MSEKVFCGKCKYFYGGCLHPSNLEDDYCVPMGGEKRTPREINRRNDCEGFTPSDPPVPSST